MDLFGAGEQIIAEVLEWDHVTVCHHRFGGTQIQLQRQTFGHLQGNSRVDILLPKDLRIEVVHQGLAEPHPLRPTSGWVTVYLGHEGDAAQAVQVLRSAYDVTWNRLHSGSLHLTF